MRRVLTFCVVVMVLCTPMLVAQTKATAENVPIIPHTSVPNFFKLPPDMYFGEGIGIATNSKGNVFVYHRSGDTRLFEFDPNGNFLKEWSASMPRTTSGSWTRERTWSSSSTPRDVS